MSALRSNLAIWRWPAVLAALTLGGLFSALLGQTGFWLPLSWLLLAVPLLVIVWCWCMRRSARP